MADQEPLSYESLPFDADALARRFDAPGVQAIALTGSYARGDAGPFSDVDLLRFVTKDAHDLAGSHLIDVRLVNVSNVGAAEVDRWFTQPDLAVNVIHGLRFARPMIDRDATFATIQARARSFVWNGDLQRRADAWASVQMVGWAEEAHKGLEGLRHNDVGRLLNARHGLSWGLSGVVQVQRGILISGDNGFFDEVEAVVGPDTEWVRLRRIVFGVTPASLRQQVGAGLRLYVVTAELVQDALQPADRPVIAHVAAQITTHLAILEPLA